MDSLSPHCSFSSFFLRSLIYEKMIISIYCSLRDGCVSTKKRSTHRGTLVVLFACLTILGILLAVAVLERPQSPQSHKILPLDNNDDDLSVDHCSMALVESIPQHVQYKANVTFGIPLEKAWKDLLSMATQELEVVSLYWMLTGEDINVNSSSDITGREIFEQLQSLPSRNISVRVVTSLPFLGTNSTDLKILKQNGVHVRKVDFGRLTNGVLHSKFWIVDRKHMFVGSANMDWRALTQVKELGVVIYNCSSLARDLHKIFQSYWVMGHSNSSLPHSWPSSLDTHINKKRPLLVNDGNITSRIYLAGSPPSFCPASRTQDLEAIISIISEAHQSIDVAVMEYFPRAHPHRYWPDIDTALRRAAFERKVKIRMLISCRHSSLTLMLPFLQSLAALDRIQIKLFILPVANQTNIPFSRVNHNKYLVTEKVAYIGTSNWSEDYFLNTAGVGLVISQHAPYPLWKTKTVQGHLKAVFNRDWHSQFAVSLADVGHHPECFLST
nr:5'-3' exonuclease PLD4-like isoform X2 [Nerophis lumbriciformis]